jgi:fumarylacetoacetase
MAESNTQYHTSWIEVDNRNDFPIQNIPFGVFRKAQNGFAHHVATRIGNSVIDLYRIASKGYFDDCGIIDIEVFNQSSLNSFAGLGKDVTRKVRNKISDLFRINNSVIRDNYVLRNEILTPVDEVEMLLPVDVTDFTDFNSSLEHAVNVGKMYRDPVNPLPPNWRHLPEGCPGRTSTIVVSGTKIHRPKGQYKPGDAAFPIYGASRRLDFELEVAFITCKESDLGSTIPVENAEEYIFGFVLLNLLTARDFQTWEQVPLGPFTSKSFGSIMSPWVVTLDAFEAFRVVGPRQEPKVLPYLQSIGAHNFDINLEVLLEPESMEPLLLCKTNYRFIYWNICQQLAHQSKNGCHIRVGDVYSSGTISGQQADSFGSLLELTWRGSKPIELPDGTLRKYLFDYDRVIMRGSGKRNGIQIGFGECVTQILPVK